MFYLASSDDDALDDPGQMESDMNDSDDDIINYDIDSVVLPTFTDELLNFPAMQLVKLLNHPVLVTDVKGAVCICEFGWRVFARITEEQNANI